jgi:hypothetical protein
MAISDNIGGAWFMEGNKSQPCAIFQAGRVLVLVNEHGALATGVVTGDDTFVIVQGSGWQSGLRCDIVDGGKTITARNGTIWRR